MKRTLTWLVVLIAAIAATVLFHARTVSATAPTGFTGATIALGRFGPIDVFNHFQFSPALGQGENEDNIWLSWQKTKGSSDLYVQNNVWTPGGSTGWHSHPGHSLIIVTAGTVTVYEGNDPTCTPTVYTKGMGFVDPGGNHVHLVRNEGTVPASVTAVQLIPAGQPRRIDAADPGNCHF